MFPFCYSIFLGLMAVIFSSNISVRQSSQSISMYISRSAIVVGKHSVFSRPHFLHFCYISVSFPLPRINFCYLVVFFDSCHFTYLPVFRFHLMFFEFLKALDLFLHLVLLKLPHSTAHSFFHLFLKQNQYHSFRKVLILLPWQ